MRKKVLWGILLMTITLTACGNAQANEVAADTVAETTETAETNAAEETPDANETAQADGIAEAIAQEQSYTEEATQESSEEETSDREPTAEISEHVPPKYTNLRVDEAGTIERITYTAHDYTADDEPEITKEANVYLPADYS